MTRVIELPVGRAHVTVDGLRRWVEQKREELVLLDARVNAVPLLDYVLAQLDEIEAPQPAPEQLLTLTAAAQISGFSPDHLGRLVRRGKIPNHGAKHAPRLRLSQVPLKLVRVASRRTRPIASRRNERAS